MAGMASNVKMGDDGGGLLIIPDGMEWRQAGLSVCLPLLSSLAP